MNTRGVFTLITEQLRYSDMKLRLKPLIWSLWKSRQIPGLRVSVREWLLPRFTY